MIFFIKSVIFPYYQPTLTQQTNNSIQCMFGEKLFLLVYQRLSSAKYSNEIMFQMYYNPHITNILELLYGNGEKKNSVVLKQCPEEFIVIEFNIIQGLQYVSLVEDFILNKELIPIGLYRATSDSDTPHFVYTNPSPLITLNEEDYIYFCTKE